MLQIPASWQSMTLGLLSYACRWLQSITTMWYQKFVLIPGLKPNASCLLVFVSNML